MAPNPLGDSVTNIQISNLHCSSCVQTIENSLATLTPAPFAVEVSVILQSVKVYHAKDLSSDAIRSALLEEGFDVALDTDVPSLRHEKHPKHLENCDLCKFEEKQRTPSSGSRESLDLPKSRVPLSRNDDQHAPSQSPVSYPDTPGLLKLVVSVGGMTCSACTNSITRAVSEVPGVSKVAVSLLDNSATVLLEDEGTSRKVIEAIDDCGFEASLISLEALKAKTNVLSMTRTLSLRVGGMFCQHCPEKVMSALKTFGTQIAIENPLTSYTDPVLTLSYHPNPPSLSIRTIMASIRTSSSQFDVTVYKPPSLEERSKALQLREQRNYLMRLAFSVIVAIPTFILGIVFMTLVKDGNPTKAYLMEPMWAGNASRTEWALFIMATPVMFYSAGVFHRRSIKEIRALWRRGSTTPILKRLVRFGSMNLLVSAGVSVAYFSSIALLALAAVQPPSEDKMGDSLTYFDSVVFLTMFLLAGRFLEAYSKARTADAITALASLRPENALLVVPSSPKSGSSASISTLTRDLEKADPDTDPASFSTSPTSAIEKIPVDLLEVGDVVRVLTGSTPPADGTIVPGERSAFDESSLTGESKPIEKSAGDVVYLGTINRGNMVHIRVDQIGGGTMLDNIVKVVREGQTRRAPMERIADKVTGYFVPVITLLAIVTWVLWLSLGLTGKLPEGYLDTEIGGWPLWSLEFAIAVFVVACPCGIGLAAPTALLVGSGLAAKFGILARGGGEAFQEMSEVDLVVFDKTGTLTEGVEPRVSDSEFNPDGPWDHQVVLGVALELESATSHPLATALVKHCASSAIRPHSGSSFSETAGRGLKATFKDIGATAIIGNEAWMVEHGAASCLSSYTELWKSQGKSVVLLAMRSDKSDSQQSAQYQIAAVFAVADVIRPEAASTVSWLQKRGIKTWLISGDNHITASAVAAAVGIPSSNVIAGVLPHEKAEKIQSLQQEPNLSRKDRRTVVAMVGDGINDAPALTVADVGIAIGSGSDIAISSASFVILSSDLGALITLADLSKAIIRRVKFNFLWAVMYNIIALPIAAGVIYPAGHARLDPVWASLAMALSSVSVICSSLLLKLYRPPKQNRST